MHFKNYSSSNLKCYLFRLQEVAQRIEHNNLPGDIFRGVVESAARMHHNGSSYGSLVNDLCSTEGLANVSILDKILYLFLITVNLITVLNWQEFMEVLHHDISQRLQDETGFTRKS